MDESKNQKRVLPVFERYPAWIILVSTGLSLSIYALGIAVVAGMGWWILTPYVLFLVYLEVSQLARGCVHCAYYGRACFSGKGLVASWFFKRGDHSLFGRRELTWLSLLPDMLVVLIPATAPDSMLESAMVFLMAFFMARQPMSVFQLSRFHSTPAWDTILPSTLTRKHLTPPEPQSIAIKWSAGK